MKILIDISDRQMHSPMNLRLQSVLSTIQRVSIDTFEKPYYADLPFVQIPDNATNGDVIKALFPNADVEETKYFDGIPSRYTVTTVLPSGRITFVVYPADWWNAPYKAESEGKHEAVDRCRNNGCICYRKAERD